MSGSTDSTGSNELGRHGSTGDRPTRTRRAYTAIWMRRIAMLAIIFAVMAMLLRFYENAREAARWSQCYGDFKGVALALHNYEATYGSLPPAYLTDSTGEPTLSWRVLILPFMESGSVYNFNLTEPWDSPTNIKLLSRMPGTFACPNHYDEMQEGFTKCVAITGPGTMFPGSNVARFADVSDGLDQTIMLAEIANVQVPWTAPVDLDIRTMSLRINDPIKPGISSPHPSGPAVLMGDGRVCPLPRAVSPEVLKAMFTISGGEAVDAKVVLER